MSILQQFANSLWNFNSYKALANIKRGKSFLYIFLLFFLAYSIFFVSSITSINDIAVNLQRAMEEDVPDFKLSNGKFSFDGPMPYIVDDNYSLFIIDTTGQTQPEDVSESLNGILITENEVVINNSGRMEITPFSTIPFELTKAQIIDFLPSIKSLAMIFLVVWFFISFGAKLFGILMLTLITMIAASIFNQKLSFGNEWNVAIYASTLPILVKALNSLLGYPLGGKMFYVYWILAITFTFLGVYNISKSSSQDIIEVQPEY